MGMHTTASPHPTTGTDGSYSATVLGTAYTVEETAMTALAALVEAKGGALSMTGTCTAGMAASRTTIAIAELAGYGNDYFNNNFYMVCLMNYNSKTNAPEREIVQITDYVTATGTFTLAGTGFSANAEASDEMLIIHESLAQMVMSYDSSGITNNFDGNLMEVVKSGLEQTTSGAFDPDTDSNEAISESLGVPISQQVNNQTARTTIPALLNDLAAVVGVDGTNAFNINLEGWDDPSGLPNSATTVEGALTQLYTRNNRGLILSGHTGGTPSRTVVQVPALRGLETGSIDDKYWAYCSYHTTPGTAPEGELVKVDSYNGTSFELTLTGTGFTVAPASGDLIVVVHDSLARLFSNYVSSTVTNNFDGGILEVVKSGLEQTTSGAYDPDTDSNEAISEAIATLTGYAAVGSGTLTTSSATLPADTGQGAKADDYWNGCLLMPLTGTCAFQPRLITDFTTTTGVFTLDALTPFTAAPGLVTYIILAGQPAQAQIAAIKAVVDTIPASGGSVNWNGTALQAIQDEAEDALEGENLDHLVMTAVPTNMATNVHADSVIGQALGTTDMSTYSRATDSQEAIRDQLDTVPASGNAATWNATALASIEGECEDALEGENLDHLVMTAVPTNMATDVHDNSIVGQMLGTSDMSTFSRTTDSLESIRDQLDTVPGSGNASTFNATALASIEAEAEDALEGEQLDHLMAVAVDTSLNTVVHDDSALGYLLATSDVNTFDRTTDSLQAIRDEAVTGYTTINANLGDASGDTLTSINAKIGDTATTVDARLTAVEGVMPASTIAAATDVSGAHSTTDALITTLDGVADDVLEDTTLFKQMILADKDDFDVADADGDSARWTADYLTGTEGGSADINTTTAGKLCVKVDPDDTPTAAMYGVGENAGHVVASKFSSWIIDLDVTWGTPAGASYGCTGIEISNLTYDTQNRVYIQKQKNNSDEQICVGAYFNNVTQTEAKVASDDDALAFKVEREDNVWRCYYSLTQYPTYTWVLVKQFEDTSEYMDATARFFVQAYSPGAADTETVQGDFNNYRKFVAVSGVAQMVAGDYDSGHVAADADGSIMERQEYHTGLIGTEYLNANGVPEVDNVRAHLFRTNGGVATKTITYDGSLSYSAFTVTGLVRARVIGYITGALSNHGDTTSVGTATSAAGLIAATAGSSMQTTGASWVDNAPSKFETFPDTSYLIGDGEDIAVVGTANLATGTVVLVCLWTPLSSDGNVVAA